MDRSKRFNYVYNSDDKLGYGKGYYIIFEDNEGSPAFDSYYPIYEKDETMDCVSVGLLNKLDHIYLLGWRLDLGYTVDLNEIFKRRED